MFVPQKELVDSDKLEIKYVRVVDAVFWDKNPKLHDIGAIIESIETNGFRDPATWDATLGAIVAGNGRTQALQIMEQQEHKMPRGILTDKDGYWCMPVLFGVDAESQEAAIRYAVDHNNLTMMGGDFSMLDVSKMWDKHGYLDVLKSLEAVDADFPITFDANDLQLLENPSVNETSSHGASISIVIPNEILAEDIIQVIEALCDDHPEWEASVNLKYFKPNSEYN